MSCLVEWFPNRRAKAILISGEAHGNYPLGWNKDRWQWLFWSTRLNATEYRFFQHVDSGYKKIEDFSNESIGVLKPSNIYKSLLHIRASLLADKEITFTIASQSAATGVSMSKLSAKHVDLYILT